MMAAQSCAGALHLFAPVCSSWTRISRGTSWRTFINPFGDLSSSWVRDANLMMSRPAKERYVLIFWVYALGSSHLVASCLITLINAIGRLVVLMLISIATHSTFVVEQPEGSTDVFPHHPRFSWLANRICVVPSQHKRVYNSNADVHFIANQVYMYIYIYMCTSFLHNNLWLTQKNVKP